MKALRTSIIVVSVLLISTSVSCSLLIRNNSPTIDASSGGYTVRDSSPLIVYFINVGQGDSILLQTPENHYMLIDAGTYNTPPYVVNFLSNHGITTLNVFVATHPHADHIGQAAAVLNMCNVLSIYHPGLYYDSATYRNFIAAAQAEGCPIYTDDNVSPGDYIPIDDTLTCQILAINKNVSQTNANDASIVLKVIYDQVSFLFMGDASSATDSTLVPNWDVNCDILKVAHHGSYSASSNYFLDEATPTVSIISCGLNNSYGHPHQETLDRLRAHNSTIYRTDLNGTVKITTDGNTYNISYETPNNPPNTPSNPNPPDGSTGVSVTADINWAGGDLNLNDIVTYDVYFGPSSTPPKVVSNQSGTSYDPGVMSYSMPYYWKIVSWDNHGASASGSVWSFTTEQPPNNPPYIPSVPSPGDGVSGVSINADLSWVGGDPDVGDSVTYDVFFGTSPTPPKVSANQSGLSYVPGTLGFLTPYYWKIVSWDNHGASSVGPVWSFTTEAQPIPPAPTQVTDITAWHTYVADLYKGIGGYPAKQYTYQSTSTESGSDLYFTFYWGDGNSTTVGPVSGSASASHYYGAKYGTYSITVTVKHGPSGPESNPSTARSVRMFKLGDCNNDNKVTFADIDPFVAMLGSHAAYVVAHPDLYWFSADCNRDNSVTFADIDPFVALLGT